MHRRHLGWMLVAALGGACAAREQAVETDASVPATAAAPAPSHLLTASGGEGGQPVGSAASSVRAPLEAGTDRAPAVPGTVQVGRESGFRESPSPDGMDAGVPIAPRRPSGPIPTMDEHRRAKPPPFDPRKAPPPGPFFPRGPAEVAPGAGNDAGPLAQ